MTLRQGPLTLRALRYRDKAAWDDIRARNRDWLKPWDPTPPAPTASLSYRQMVRRLNALGRAGETYSFAVVFEDRFVGQVTLGGVVRGSALYAHIGYWIDAAVAGRGVIPTAVAMAVDYGFGPVGLHRIEINVRPENAASLRVVDKLGFRYEGLRPRFLHIDGDWRDHKSFALTKEELPGGAVARLHEQGIVPWLAAPTGTSF